MLTVVKNVPPNAGFTLIELLVAMTLLGLLTIALSSSLHFGTRVWEKSERSLMGQENIREQQMILADQISHLYPLMIKDGSSDSHVAFYGSQNQLTFYTSVGSASGNLMHVEIKSSDSSDGITLSRTVTPELSTQKGTETVLLHKIQSVSISYFGAKKNGEVPGWFPSWEKQTRPPELIRIRIAFLPGNAAVWPDLIVATHVSADIGCSFDALTKFCGGR